LHCLQDFGLEVSMFLEGPTTGHSDKDFLGFSLFPIKYFSSYKFSTCYNFLVLQSCLSEPTKLNSFNVNITKFHFKTIHLIVNSENQNSASSVPKPQILNILASSFSCNPHQNGERILTMWSSSSRKMTLFSHDSPSHKISTVLFLLLDR
jgi:hypothetical protein